MVKVEAKQPFHFFSFFEIRETHHALLFRVFLLPLEFVLGQLGYLLVVQLLSLGLLPSLQNYY